MEDGDEKWISIFLFVMLFPCFPECWKTKKTTSKKESFNERLQKYRKKVERQNYGQTYISAFCLRKQLSGGILIILRLSVPQNTVNAALLKQFDVISAFDNRAVFHNGYLITEAAA